MKRLLLMLGLVGLLAVASACGGGGEKEVTIPGADGNVKVTAGDKLPSGFPDDFPIFKDAKVTGSVQGEQEGKTGFFVTWETDASVDDVTSFYKEELAKDPWKTVGVFSTAEGSLISFTRADNEDYGGGVTISGDGKTQFVVFAGEGAGLAPGDQTEEAEQPTPEAEATTEEEEQPSAQAELPDEVDLPNGYPADVAPIPDDGRVTEASSYSSGGQTSFVVTYLTEEAPDSIADFYDEQTPGGGWSQTSRYSSGGEVVATYENPDSGGELVISATVSDTYEGYTEVGIMLSTGE